MTQRLPALFIGSSKAARKTFGKAIPTVWRHAFTALAMPNHAAETWNPPPAIAQVSQLWQDP
jgi:hypothetical protein